MSPTDLTPTSAESWVLIIAAISSLLTSVIAALKASKASTDANVTKNQVAINQATMARTETKLDHNTEITKLIQKQTNGGPKVCAREDCPQRIVPPEPPPKENG